VHHGLAEQPMAVKPNAAVEGKAHSLTAAFELSVMLRYEQVILPSAVAFPTGDAFPEYR
jgi:hypothetical protein